MAFPSEDHSMIMGHAVFLMVLCSFGRIVVATDAENWSLVDTQSVVCTASDPAAPGRTIIALPNTTTVNVPYVLSFYLTSDYATTITLKLEDSSSTPQVMVPQMTVALDPFTRRRLDDSDALLQAEKVADPSDWFGLDEEENKGLDAFDVLAETPKRNRSEPQRNHSENARVAHPEDSETERNVGGRVAKRMLASESSENARVAHPGQALNPKP